MNLPGPEEEEEVQTRPDKSRMAILRRPVSQRRSIKSRKATMAKKTYYRPTKKSGGQTSAGVITGLSPNNYGFPDRLKTRLRYCDVVQLEATAGNPGLWQFRLSSLYDPDYTGTGHQPQWYDQLVAVYQRYRVLGAKITVTFSPNQVSDTEANDKGPYIVGITTSENATFGSGTSTDLLEDNNSTHSVLADKQGANNVKTLEATYSPIRDLGLGNGDDVMMALSNANPARNIFANVWALDMTENAAVDVVAKVCIEFWAEFSAPRTTIRS